MNSKGQQMERDLDERLKSLTMRIHQTEELVTNMKTSGVPPPLANPLPNNASNDDPT